MTCRIVFIITGLSTGGAEIMLLKLLEHMDRNYFSPSVISLTSKGEIGDQIERLGITVLELGMSNSKLNLWEFLLLLKSIRSLKPQLVHTCMYHADLLGGLAAKISGVKHIVWNIRQSNLSPELNSKPTLRVMKICARLSNWLPDKIFCNSSAAQLSHELAGYQHKKMMVIPNGFDLKKFSPIISGYATVRDEFLLSANTKIVGLVARFDPQKNHLGFLKAAGVIHKSRPDIHFLLIGSGVDSNNDLLVRSMADHKVENVVHLLGRRDDIPYLMSAFDLLVSSSNGESFPNVLGEAMASGVPCVATDVGECAEIIGNSGRVVMAGDMENLAKSVLELLKLPKTELNKLGRVARARVEECYEISSVTNRFETFYKQIIRGVA
jgi:glycosyltransferase involved in cell wall biosynthesis